MSEKRFKVLSGGFDEEGNPLYRIDTTDMIGDYEICKKVIEQQATITKLKELNDDKGKRIISLIRTNKTLKEENEQLQKETVFLAYWKRKAMILLMQVRRLTPRMTDEEVMEFSKELDDE